MCFHSKQSQDAQKLENRFKAKITDIENFQSPEHYKGFQHPKTPVIIHENKNIIQHFQWGLIPTWAKDDSIKKYTLNAKIETLNEKPSFKNYVNQRCLIIVNGFFEWQWLDKSGKRKQKYLISFPNDELFTFGGIWSQWRNSKNHQVIQSYSIVTTKANDLMAEIHNSKQRMPLVLNKNEEEKWLSNASLEDFKIRNIELKATAINTNKNNNNLLSLFD